MYRPPPHSWPADRTADVPAAAPANAPRMTAAPPCGAPRSPPESGWMWAREGPSALALPSPAKSWSGEAHHQSVQQLASDPTQFASDAASRPLPLASVGGSAGVAAAARSWPAETPSTRANDDAPRT